MSVPSFSDLGKSARDVFKTGYHYGKSLIKLTAKSKSNEQLEVNSDLALDCDALKLTGVADAKYKMKEYGYILEKWTSDGTLSLGYYLNGDPVPDVGLLSEISYNPSTSAKIIKIGADCIKQADVLNKFNLAEPCPGLLGPDIYTKSNNKQGIIASDMNSNVNMLGSIVTAVKGLLIGYRAGYSTETNKMTKNDIGLAFSHQDIGFHFRCTSIPNEYGLSVFYKVNADWDAAVNGILARSGSIQEWTLGAAAKWKIDDNSAFRCKFNTDLQCGMSLQQKLDENVMVTLSFNIDCANVTRGGHKFGLAVEMEA